MEKGITTRQAQDLLSRPLMMLYGYFKAKKKFADAKKQVQKKGGKIGG